MHTLQVHTCSTAALFSQLLVKPCVFLAPEAAFRRPKGGKGSLVSSLSPIGCPSKAKVGTSHL